MNDFDRILNRLEVARQYDEYLPGEGEGGYPEENERESFNRLLDQVEDTVTALKIQHEEDN